MIYVIVDTETGEFLEQKEAVNPITWTKEVDHAARFQNPDWAERIAGVLTIKGILQPKVVTLEEAWKR